MDDDEIWAFFALERPEFALGAQAQPVVAPDFTWAFERHEFDFTVLFVRGGTAQHLIGGDGVKFVETIKDNDLYAHGELIAKKRFANGKFQTKDRNSLP